MEKPAGQIALAAAVLLSSSLGWRILNILSLKWDYDTFPILSALSHTFLLFLRTAERFREDYDIAVAMLASPQVADRYGYELRLFDEAGFAYRGPMLSVVVKKELFWTQVS